jgi:hypothetical protein
MEPNDSVSNDNTCGSSNAVLPRVDSCSLEASFGVSVPAAPNSLCTTSSSAPNHGRENPLNPDSNRNQVKNTGTESPGVRLDVVTATVGKDFTVNSENTFNEADRGANNHDYNDNEANETTTTTTATSTTMTATSSDSLDVKEEHRMGEAILCLISSPSILVPPSGASDAAVASVSSSTKEHDLKDSKAAKASSMAMNKNVSVPEYKDQVQSRSILVQLLAEEEETEQEVETTEPDEYDPSNNGARKPSYKQERLRNILGGTANETETNGTSSGSVVAYSLNSTEEGSDTLSSIPTFRSPAAHRIAITDAPSESDLPCVTAQLIPGAEVHEEEEEESSNPRPTQDDLHKMMAAIKKEERRFWMIVLISAIIVNSILISAVVVAAFCASGNCGKKTDLLPVTIAPSVVVPIPTVRPTPPTFAPPTIYPTAFKEPKSNPGVSKGPSVQPPAVGSYFPTFSSAPAPIFVIPPFPMSSSAPEPTLVNTPSPTFFDLATADPTSSNAPSFVGQTKRPTSYPTQTVFTEPPVFMIPGPMSPPTAAPSVNGAPTRQPTSTIQTVTPTLFSTIVATETPTFSNSVSRISGEVTIRLYNTPGNWTEMIKDDYIEACDRFWEDNLALTNLTVQLISSSFILKSGLRRLSSQDNSHILDTTLIVEGMAVGEDDPNLQDLLPNTVNQNKTGFIATIQDQDNAISRAFYEHVTNVDAYAPDKVPPQPSSTPTSAPTKDDGADGSNVPIAAIVGIAIVLELLFCTGLYLYYRRWKARRLVGMQNALSKQPAQQSRFREPSYHESTNAQEPDHPPRFVTI